MVYALRRDERMKCPACHTENTAEAKFCGNCGHSLTEEAVAK